VRALLKPQISLLHHKRTKNDKVMLFELTAAGRLLLWLQIAGQNRVRIDKNYTDFSAHFNFGVETLYGWISSQKPP